MNFLCNNCNKIVSDIICPHCYNFTIPITSLIDEKDNIEKLTPEEFEKVLKIKIESSNILDKRKFDSHSLIYFGKLCYECGLGLRNIKQ